MKTMTPPFAPSERVVSLDAFRGFVMLSMLLETLGLEKFAGRPVLGTLFTQLNHAAWVGFHFEDYILPAFLFIIGVSMAISDEKRRARGEAYRPRLFHALRRGALLFVLGFLLSWLAAGKPYWGAGVLQVLALSYFGAFLVLGLSLRARAAVSAGFSSCTGPLFSPSPSTTSGATATRSSRISST